MSVHFFGGVWSASCGNYALLKMAQDHSSDFHPSIKGTVARKFYIDNCLKSVKSESRAIFLVDQLRELLQCGGFNPTKWVCNSRSVLGKIAQPERAKEVEDLNLSYNSLPTERALGIHWNVEHDALLLRPKSRKGLQHTWLVES